MGLPAPLAVALLTAAAGAGRLSVDRNGGPSGGRQNMLVAAADAAGVAAAGKAAQAAAEEVGIEVADWAGPVVGPGVADSAAHVAEEGNSEVGYMPEAGQDMVPCEVQSSAAADRRSAAVREAVGMALADIEAAGTWRRIEVGLVDPDTNMT
ncbi:hypothetical protein BDY21DRAFT_360275 [Lineolata rhizophorae]|uniref:Uncharacterized protein n=1 Tax=Lineolata rhizophorae TaxID=578093 RepID=A0A6A6PF06_9PEZI|nr:hypothetical protein BDY21DRAFT_360275 [Lineolata rhizophorae]